MNRLILSCLAVLLVVFTVQAQDDPAKAIKKASGDLRTFELDPANNLDKLNEALDRVDFALQSGSIDDQYDTWKAAGDVYNTLSNQIVAARQSAQYSQSNDQLAGLVQASGPALEDLPEVENPALKAFDAYQRASALAEKKFQTKDILKGLRSVQTNLNNMGIYAYEEQQFEAAYVHFAAVLEAHTLLDGTKDGSMLASEEDYQEQLYITGLAALSANKVEEATPLFNELKEAGAQKAAIYEALYKIEAADALAPNTTLSEEEQTASLEKAYANLEQGRAQFPDDVSLLFAEINHFLRINQLDVLIGKLESAIEKEPDNISLYSTMGNVYDNLYQRELATGDEGEAQKHFDSALNYYSQALEKDPKFTDAIYSIGALYFNKAATMTQELQSLANDFSKEATARYDKLQTEVNAEFDKALPYFIQVEKLKPADINTLIALKEIYARKSDFEKSNEFKARLEAVQADPNAALESYFEAQGM